MNEKLDIDVKTLKPFTKFIYTIGELPTSYLMSMTYEEQLVWLCNYLSKTVIPTINNNAEAVKEVQDLVLKLQEYINNYFDNLDVQEEINNKLDVMAESGELADIIAQYLSLAGILAFNTISDMKNAENISNGSFAKTLGYNTLNDGGASLYKIRNITNTDIVNDEDIVALNDNTLIAELILNTTINPIQFGCYGNGVNDDTDRLQDVINYAINNKITLVSDKNKTYKISNTLVLDGIIQVDFGNSEINANINSNIIELKVTDGKGYDTDKEVYYAHGGYLKNLIINGNGIGTGIRIAGQKKMTISNIEIVNCNIGLHGVSATECVVDTIRFQKCNTGLLNEASDVVYKNLFGRFCNVGMDLQVYTNVFTSHFWVRDEEPEFNNSIYAKVLAGATLENVDIDNYQTGVKLLGTGSYPLLISGRCQQINNDKEYTLFDVTSGSYNATGGAIRLHDFNCVCKSTQPLVKFSNVETDVFTGEIDYASCRFLNMAKFPLTTHTKLINTSSKIEVLQNRVNITGYNIHVQFIFKVLETFKYEKIGELPVMQNIGVPLLGKSFVGVTSAQYSISNSEQLIGGFVTRNNNINIATLDNQNIPVGKVVCIDFSYVAESRQSLTE